MAVPTRDLSPAQNSACNGSLEPHLEADLRQTLHAISRFRSYAAGQTMLESATEPCFVGNIVAGVSRLIRRDAEGRVQLVGFMVASDVFGHPYSRHGPFSIEAATDTTICQFERRAFAALVHQSPSLQQHLISRTLDELDGTREWLSLLGGRTAMERVASFLIILVRSAFVPRPGWGRCIVADLRIPISRADFAHYLGMTPETLSRCIHRLADRNVIRIVETNRFEIVDMPELARASGNAEIPLGPAFARMSQAFSA